MAHTTHATPNSNTIGHTQSANPAHPRAASSTTPTAPTPSVSAARAPAAGPRQRHAVPATISAQATACHTVTAKRRSATLRRSTPPANAATIGNANASWLHP